MDDIMEMFVGLKKVEAEASINKAKLQMVTEMTKQQRVNGFCDYLARIGQADQLSNAAKGKTIDELIKSYKELVDNC